MSAPIGEPLQFPPLFDRRSEAAFYPCLNGIGKWYLEGPVAEVSFRRAGSTRLMERINATGKKQCVFLLAARSTNRLDQNDHQAANNGLDTQRSLRSARHQLQAVCHQHLPRRAVNSRLRRYDSSLMGRTSGWTDRRSWSPHHPPVQLHGFGVNKLRVVGARVEGGMDVLQPFPASLTAPWSCREPMQVT
jgi:hypothetical protein